ncbi:hypothetical protein X773_33125 [Mesorhizobium sp. LSJC285A00]|nr:hypothetical protein X773_33125 [Mesorhizobium sp. LSJC285A00]
MKSAAIAHLPASGSTDRRPPHSDRRFGERTAASLETPPLTFDRRELSMTPHRPVDVFGLAGGNICKLLANSDQRKE